MPEPNTKGKFPLMIYMDAELAKRLAVAAAAQKQPAENLVINMLDKSLPRLQTGSKDKIPYT
jgi:predicted HicB family RNase H-like nuclease